MEHDSCFFCAKSLASHRNNGEGHVWREGNHVTWADFARNDRITQEVHAERYAHLRSSSSAEGGNV